MTTSRLTAAAFSIVLTLAMLAGIDTQATAEPSSQQLARVVAASHA